MKGTAKKSYYFLAKIDAEILTKIRMFILEYYDQLVYSIETINGHEYNNIQLTDVLDYSNTKIERIKKIVIKGYKQEAIRHSIYIQMRDSKTAGCIFYIEINDEEPKELTYYMAELKKLIYKSRTSRYLSELAIQMSFCILFSVVVYFIVDAFSLVEQISKYNILLALLIGMMFGLISNFIMRILRARTVFCIGEQVEYFSKRRKVFNYLIFGAANAIVMSIIAGIILHLILN